MLGASKTRCARTELVIDFDINKHARQAFIRFALTQNGSGVMVIELFPIYSMDVKGWKQWRGDEVYI
jgi:hypothetical protein